MAVESINKYTWTFASITAASGAVILLFVVLKFLVYTIKYYHAIANAVKVKGPKPYFPFGTLYVLKDGFLSMKDAYEMGDKERGMSCLWLWNKQYILISHASHIKKMFQGGKGRGDTSSFAHVYHVIGKDAFSMFPDEEYDRWKDRRHMVGRAFHFKNLPTLCGTMIDLGERMVEVLDERIARDNGFVDVEPFMRGYSLDVIGIAAFGYKFESLEKLAKGEPLNRLARAFQHSFAETSRRQFHPNPFLGVNWVWLPTASNQAYNKARSYLRDQTLKVIKNRRKQIERGDVVKEDLLNNMITAKDDEGLQIPFTDSELRDNTVLFLFAGFDTSSVTLMNCFYTLSKNPEKQKKLFQEVNKVLSKDDGSYKSPVYGDIAKLKYTRCVIHETLRLLPTALSSGRLTDIDLDFDGIHIPKGTMIFADHSATHSSSDNWDNPTEFIPERFQDNDETKHEFHSWIPFGGGIRNCVGQRFAMVETVLALAILIRNYEFALQEGYIYEKEAQGFVQCPKNGMPVKLTKRKV